MISCRIFCAAILLSAIALPTSAVSSEGSHADNDSAPGQPKYLIFWAGPDRAAKIAERVGMKGDGKTRLLGFGDVIYTFDAERGLAERIRKAFRAAVEQDMAVMFAYDFHYFWKSRPDLWNWFDPDQPGYHPKNRLNVEWHGWDGPPNKVRYLNWGQLERIAPHVSFTSEEVRAEIKRLVSEVIVPVTLEELDKLKAIGKEQLFAGIVVGSEPSIEDYSHASTQQQQMMREDGVAPGPLGYRCLLDRGYSAENPPENFRQALAEIVQETVSFWCEQFAKAGVPKEKLTTHVAAPAPVEQMNAPIWTAFNDYSVPGWTTYAVMVLGSDFSAIYDPLEKHGNPSWAGVEANAGFPGSVVDWETYLAWHFNHGCYLVGINNGATGEDLPRRLRDSSFSQEAMAAYHRFLKGEPLVEQAVSLDNPQLRVMAKTKRIHAALAKWREERKEITPELQTLLKEHTELAQAAKFEELDELCDKVLDLLGAGDQGMTDVYGQE